MGKKEVIITTNCPDQATYWQTRLPEAHVIYEDWPGGAGNGLGTLYAFQKSALTLAPDTSIALYHTAGKGTRLAPLPGSEWNNKSAVKLPGGTTLLEAVMEQTQSLLSPGRLSVFWGDQLFFPTIPLKTPERDVEIFAKVQRRPTQKEWQAQRLDRYGLLLTNPVRQLEKISWDTFAKLPCQSVGVSLGSFSLSSSFLEELLATFSNELAQKRGKQDTDRDWWMPERFGPGRLGIIDIGADATWWDFGNLNSYHKNCLKMGPSLVNCEIEDLEMENSILINVKAKRVRAKNAVMIDVTAPEIDVTDGLLYNVSDETPISISESARADAHGLAFVSPIHGGQWDEALPGNPMSFSDLYNLNQKHILRT